MEEELHVEQQVPEMAKEQAEVEVEIEGEAEERPKVGNLFIKNQIQQ